jgi:hypothetical protein
MGSLTVPYPVPVGYWWLRYKIRVREFAADNFVVFTVLMAVLGGVLGWIVRVGPLAGPGALVGLLIGVQQGYKLRRGTPGYERVRDRQDAKMQTLEQRRGG